ncbi:MAG: class B sortase [Clostridia bacterium]|nr:class B sortase [Clostridia bacterium]
MKRLMAMLLALLLPAAALAGEGAWFYPALTLPHSEMQLLTDDQLDRIAALPSKEIHALVEAMFLAAAGVEEHAELKLWKTFRTEAEKEARGTENAAYRARTLPWLKAAFAPGNPAAEAEPAALRPAPTPEPTAAPLTQATAAEEQARAWTAEDSVAAFRDNVYGQKYLAQLETLGGTDARRCLAVTQAVIQRWLAELDHDRLAEANPHYQLWIYAPGMPIDYPVVQCSDNSYYLDRLFNRKKNPAGTLFVDCRNLPELQDPNTLIYGHHMRDGSMFHSLTDYDAGGFFEAHPFMVMISRDEIHLVEIFAGYVTDSRDHCYDIALSDEADMRAFVEAAQEKSDFNAHVEVDCRRDRLVTLSTCAYNFEKARCVVIGRLSRVWYRPWEME